MGIKGRRQTKQQTATEEYKEPQLIVGVEKILEESAKQGYVDNDGNINIETVTESQNIKIAYELMEASQSGYLKNIDGLWIIGVNKLHHPRRQRFTIAHELGHYFLHREKNLDFEDATFFRNDNSAPIEYSANEFAACLLMPENRLRAAISDGNKNLEKLALKFNVSLAAIKFRVISLGYKMKENG